MKFFVALVYNLLDFEWVMHRIAYQMCPLATSIANVCSSVRWKIQSELHIESHALGQMDQSDNMVANCNAFPQSNR